MNIQTAQKEMNQYIAKLKSMDWFYDYSDSYQVWNQGRIQILELYKMASRLDRNYVHWNYYCKNNDLKQITLLGGKES